MSDTPHAPSSGRLDSGAIPRYDRGRKRALGKRTPWPHLAKAWPGVQRPEALFTGCKAFAPAARLSALALLVAAVTLVTPAAARSLESLLIVSDGAEYDAAGYSRVVSVGRT